MSEMSMEYCWERDVLKFFGVNSLFDHQKEVIQALLDNRDMFLSVCTGGGKSLCFMAYPIAAKAQYQQLQCGPCGDEIVLVVSPLTAIMLEQCRTLNTLGLTAVCLGQQDDAEEILNGKFQFVFTSPENILENKLWRSMLRNEVYQSLLHLIVVDEAHTVSQWGQPSASEDQPFRVWYSRLGELRSLVPSSVLLAVTATASKHRRKEIKKLLSMKTCSERIENPERDNIKLHVKNVPSSTSLRETFSWCLDLLSNAGVETPRVLIFCKSISDCSKMYTTFKMYLTAEMIQFFDMYHSQTPEETKSTIRKDMSDVNGHIRVLICTSAAGMGVNFAAVNHVVNYGPPQEMDTMLQQLGRAGRTGEQALHLVLFHNRQLRNVSPEVLEYVRNDTQCRRHLMLSFYASHPSNVIPVRCCDVCDKNNNGTDFSDDVNPLWSQKSDSESNSETDDQNVSAEALRSLRVSLKQHQLELNMKENDAVCNPEEIHGITDNVIDSILQRALLMSTPDDVLANCGIVSYEQAKKIFKIIQACLELVENMEFSDNDDFAMDDVNTY